MRVIVTAMYDDNGQAETRKLIHPYDLDLNHDEVFSEIKTINSTLIEAISATTLPRKVIP